MTQISARRLIIMNIYCHRLLVVFCQGIQDVRGLERLIDKHKQLMYLTCKHAKLHEGQLWRAFSANWQPSIFYSLEEGHLVSLDSCDDPHLYFHWFLMNVHKKCAMSCFYLSVFIQGGSNVSFIPDRFLSIYFFQFQSCR